MKENDIDQLLDLFAEDSVIYEPFSKSLGLKTRMAIESFLAVTMMIAEGLRYSIVIERNQGDRMRDEVTALVTFEKGGKTKYRYKFEFMPEDSSVERKIKALHIQFAE